MAISEEDEKRLRKLADKWAAASFGNAKTRDDVIVKQLYREVSDQLMDVLGLVVPPSD